MSQVSLTQESKEVGRSEPLRARDTPGHADRAWKHDRHKTKAQFLKAAACRERQEVLRNGLGLLDSVKGTNTLTCPKNHTIYSQGDMADAVFYIQAGKLKLTVVSQQGKQAVVAILERGAFFGECCLAGSTVHIQTAITMEDSCVVRIDKEVMIRLLHEEPTVSEVFLTHLLSHSMRLQADVVDHLFNSAEKRLARALLLLAHFEEDGQPEVVVTKINQETLAEMIGTTRSRISYFLNRFCKMGFVRYDGMLHVHHSLHTVVLDDGRPSYG